MVEIGFEQLAPVSVQVDDGLDVPFVHQVHQPPDVVHGPAIHSGRVP